MRPRSEPVVAIATLQPWFGSPSTSSSGDEHVVEEHLGEAFVAVEPFDAAHRDAGRGQVDEEVGEAAMAFGFGIGAEQPEEMRAERAARRPRLLARTAANRRPRRRARPGSGCRRGRCRRSAPTSPGTTSARPTPSWRRMRVLLLGRAELEDRRREQEDAVLRHPLRRAGAVVLLLEDQPLPEAGVATAVLCAATTPPRSARRTASAPTRGARRSPRGCRPTAARGGARWPRATPGTRRETLLFGAEGEIHGRRAIVAGQTLG